MNESRYLSPAAIGLNGVTATTTSSAIDVRGAKKVTLFLKRADHTSGSTAFSVTGSIDGVNYVTSNMIIDNLTNTNAQHYTRVASKALSANSTVVVGLDVSKIPFRYIKVTATETTDGTHTASALVEF
jgi:hypothetical protein